MIETCGATTKAGTPCGVQFGLCDICGECFNHCEHRKRNRRVARSKGGKATARKRSPSSLLAEDLPPLTSHEAAEQWTDVIGRSAATGRLSSAAANAALRAVKEWRESHDAGAVSERLDALTKAMKQWRKTGDPAPVLELVKGDA